MSTALAPALTFDNFAESAQNPHTSLRNGLVQAFRGSFIKPIE